MTPTDMGRSHQPWLGRFGRTPSPCDDTQNSRSDAYFVAMTFSSTSRMTATTYFVAMTFSSTSRMTATTGFP
jgi:hypothetical protein